MDEALIQDFLDGILQEPAKSQFEDRLKTDEALRKLVEEYSTLRQMLPKALALEQEKARVRAILEQAHTPQKPRRAVWWYAAASLLLACALAWLLWPSGSCGEKLAYTYFAELSTPGFITQSMGTPGPEKPLFEQATEAYHRNDISSAKSRFAAITPEEANYQRAQIMLGTIALNEKLTQDAIGYLETAHSLNAEDHHASWYLALAYLADCQKTKAKPLLEQVAKARKGYHIKAKKLLQE